MFSLDTPLTCPGKDSFTNKTQLFPTNNTLTGESHPCISMSIGAYM